MRRIDHQLMVKELNAKLFRNCISEATLLKALTAPAIGYGFDYEQLELFGQLRTLLAPQFTVSKHKSTTLQVTPS